MFVMNLILISAIYIYIYLSDCIYLPLSKFLLSLNMDKNESNSDEITHSDCDVSSATKSPTEKDALEDSGFGTGSNGGAAPLTLYSDEEMDLSKLSDSKSADCNKTTEQTCGSVDTQVQRKCTDAIMLTEDCNVDQPTKLPDVSTSVVDMFKSSSSEENNGNEDKIVNKDEDVSIPIREENNGLDLNFADGKDMEKCKIDETMPCQSNKESKKNTTTKKRTTDESNSDSSKSSMEVNNPHPTEAKKPKTGDVTDSDSDDEFLDARGDVDDEVMLRRRMKRRLWNLTSSSNSDEDSSSSSDSDKSSEEDSEKMRLEKKQKEEEEEKWLEKDISHLPKPRWRSVIELRNRQILQSSQYWPYKVCGSQSVVRRFQRERELQRHSGCVNALHFNQTGSLLATGSDDLRIILWDWISKKSGRPAVVYESGHKSNVFQAKFLPECGDSTVVSSARDGQVRVADISSTGTCRGTKKVAQHRGSAHKLSLDIGTRSTFLSCGEDGAVFGIDLRLDKPADKLVTVKSDNRKIPLYSIHTNPSRPYEFAVSGRDENARIYDRRMINDIDEAAEPVKLYCPHHLQAASDMKANITCLMYNWDGSELLCSYNDEDIYLFDTNHSTGADYTKRYKGHRNNATVKGVNFYGPHSEFIVSGSDCGNIFFWEKESSRVLGLMQGDEGGVVNVLEPHPNLPIIATSGLDDDIKIWSPAGDPIEENNEMSQLRTFMLTNRREREDERRSMPDMIDGHMLWFLMRTLRNRTRRRNPGGRGEDSSSDDLSSSSDDSSSDDEDGRRTRCTQS